MAVLNNPSGKLLYRDISGSRKQLDTPVRPMQTHNSSAAKLIVEDHEQFTIYTLIGITNAFPLGKRRNTLLTPFLSRLCLLVYFSVF